MFKMVSSPHTHGSNLTAKFMLWVMVAMLPALVVQCYYFGVGVLVQVIIAVSFAVVIELTVAKLRRKPTAFYLADLSGILTALILAMSIPPYSPYWIVMIGVIVALLLAKHIYGGLGQNLFNPAMVAYALLLISFPVQMTSWSVPSQLLSEPPTMNDAFHLVFTGVTSDGFSLRQLVDSVDGITQATPLDSAKLAMKAQGFIAPELAQNISDKLGFNGWFQINLAFLIGGIFLIVKRIIHWQISVAMLAVFVLCSYTDNTVKQLAFADSSSALWETWQHLFSGAMMFGAFFIATDPVSASITPRGKLIFGGLIGLLVYLIRYYGNYPDAVAFSVLLANICVPLIDHYSQPRLYGTRR